MVWEAKTWKSAQQPGRPPDYIKGQIGGFVLHKLCHGADLTISAKDRVSQISHTCITKAGKLNFIIKKTNISLESLKKC